MDDTTRFDSRTNKRMQTGRGCIGYLLHPYSPDSFPIDLRSNDYQRFSLHLPPAQTFFETTNVGLINLNNARQSISARPYHGPTQLMQHQPRSFVATQSKHPLQTKGAGAVFLTGHPPTKSPETIPARANANGEISFQQSRKSVFGILCSETRNLSPQWFLSLGNEDK